MTLWRFRQQVQQLWYELSLYLPIALIGVTALATYWLVRTTPAPGAPAEPRAEVHEPDYFMKRFSLKTYDVDGRLKSEVFGAEARHYPDTDTLEIDDARLLSYGPTGVLTVATARRAITNGDGSQVQLIGNARVVREDRSDSTAPGPRLEFKGEFLHAYLDTERVISDQPVQITRGSDRFEAQRMAYDHVEQTLSLGGRVRGTLMPGTGSP